MIWLKDDTVVRTPLFQASPGRRDKTEVETSFLSAEVELEICWRFSFRRFHDLVFYLWMVPFFLQGIILTKLSEEMFVNFQSFLITFCLNCQYDFYEIECENRIVAAIFIRVLKRRVGSVVSSSITWNNLDYFFLLLLFLFLFQLFETKPIEERIIK